MPRVEIFYAVKVLDEEQVVSKCISQNTGFDVASPNEMEKVINLGGDPNRIIFANPVKSVE